MFYPPFTVYKDGAMMICEDASEFDTNYDAPNPPPEVAKVEIIAMVADKDPVDKFADKMSIVYDQVVEPMTQQSLEYDNPQQAIDMCEKLTRDATNIFNTMRIKLTKLAGIVCGGLNEHLASESFQSHAGTFMNNAALIKKQGVERYPVTWKELPTFSNPWAITNIVEVISAKPEVLGHMIYEPELVALCGENNAFRNFNGFVDMMNCIFKDKERLDRLSVEVNYPLDFTALLQDGLEIGSNDYIAKENQMMIVKYLKLLPWNLRMISHESYTLQNGIIDGHTTPEDFEHRMHDLITTTVNLFGIGVGIGCYFATCLRRSIAKQKACDAYTELLLDTIKKNKA